MSTEIASAYLALYTKMPGVKGDIEKSLGGSEVQGAADKSGRGLGGRLMGAAGKAAAAGAIAVGATIAAGVGAALVKGFARLDALDQATAKLDGLGHSAQSIDGIMQNALASVRGTAFGLDAAAGVAGTLVASGIAPGMELERVLKLVADSATIAGTDMTDMGSIFGKVAARGKLDGEVLQQLLERNIGILPKLASMYGVTNEEAQKMVSQGKVSFEDFASVMQNTLGGAALSSGDTFRGALANVGASLGRIGAGIFGGIFPQIAPLLQAFTTALGPLEVVAGSVGEKIGSFLAPGIQWLTDALNSGIDFGGILEAVTSFSPLMLVFQTLAPLLPVILPALQQLASVIGGALATVLPMVVPVLLQLVTMFAQLAAEILPVLVPAIAGALVPIISALVPVIGTLLAALAPIVQAVLPILASLFQALAPIVLQLVAAFLPLLTPILALITPLLDLVMVILPPLAQIIGFLIQAALVPLQLAIAVLIPVITGVVNALSTYLQPVIKTITDVLAGLVTFITGVFTGNWKMAWQGIQDIFSGIWNGVQSIARGAINGIIDLVNGAIEGINGLAGGLSDLTGGSINLSIPTIPRLATGAIVRNVPGGVLANIGEGRYPEAVTPLAGPQFKRLATAFASEVGSTPGGGVVFNGPVIVRDERELVREQEKSMTRARMGAGGRLVTG